MLIKLCK